MVMRETDTDRDRQTQRTDTEKGGLASSSTFRHLYQLPPAFSVAWPP